MQVPIVSPQQAQGETPASGVAAANGSDPRAAATGIFAMLLAQQSAPQVAEAVGAPVLILPDGSLVVAFDPNAVPEGATVVMPPVSEASISIGEAQTTDGESVETQETDTQGLPAAALVSSASYLVGPAQEAVSEPLAADRPPEAGVVQLGSGDALRSSASYTVGPKTVSVPMEAEQARVANAEPVQMSVLPKADAPEGNAVDVAPDPVLTSGLPRADTLEGNAADVAP